MGSGWMGGVDGWMGGGGWIVGSGWMVGLGVGGAGGGQKRQQVNEKSVKSLETCSGVRSPLGILVVNCHNRQSLYNILYI